MPTYSPYEDPRQVSETLNPKPFVIGHGASIEATGAIADWASGEPLLGVSHKEETVRSVGLQAYGSVYRKP